MEFQLLGAVTCTHDGERLELGRRQERCLLGLLLLEPRRIVPVGRLLSLLWGDDAPATGRNTLQTYVARLRTRLTPYDVPIARQGAGYSIDVDPLTVDVHRFVAESLQAKEIDNPAERAAALDRALGIWNGPLLGDVADDDLRRRLDCGIEEQKLLTTEWYLEAELANARHDAVVGALIDLVQLYPTRERLVELLMLALYRSGRQVDALAAYRRLRETLVAELGIEPTPEVQRLHQRILNNDHELTRPPVVQRSRRYLPRDVPDFTGRAMELVELDRLASAPTGTANAMLVTAIAGTAGVGKTALAVHWAHRVRERYPDGQLFVNLRGYDPRGPMGAAEALGALLRALDVPADRVPDDVDEAAALYRATLADQRTLVLLDNASSVDQVRPLLPATSGSLVLITSRDALGGLVARDGARRLVIDSLPPEQAVELLAAILGNGRIQAEPAAARQLATACGHLPLALRIAAANLAGRAGTSIADHLAELAGDRLGELSVEGDRESAVTAVFDQSYRSVPIGERETFRRLGLIPGADFTIDVAAAVSGLSIVEATCSVQRLVDANLVTAPLPERFVLHDLVRLYAAHRAAVDDDELSRSAAVERLLTHYLRVARDAAAVASPQTMLLSSTVDEDPDRFPDAAAALGWFRAEQANLLAAIHLAARLEQEPFAWLISDAMRGYFWLQRDFRAWVESGEAGLAAARTRNDVFGAAAAQLSLGLAYRSVSRLPEAIAALGEARTRSEEAGWLDGLATATGTLAIAHAEAGQMVAAGDLMDQALRLNRVMGRTRSIAVTLLNLGGIRLDLGDLRGSVAHSNEALRLYREMGSRMGEAAAHGNLGIAYGEMGQWDDARSHLEQSRVIADELGDRSATAVALVGLGELSRRRGQVTQARDHLMRAQDVAGEIDDERTRASARIILGYTYCQSGQAVAARSNLSDSLAVARTTGQRLMQASALNGLAQVGLLEKNLDDAEAAVREALTIARSDGFQTETLRALTTLAEIRQALGDEGGAAEAARESLALSDRTGYPHDVERARDVLGPVSGSTPSAWAASSWPAGSGRCTRRGTSPDSPGAPARPPRTGRPPLPR